MQVLCAPEGGVQTHTGRLFWQCHVPSAVFEGYPCLFEVIDTQITAFQSTEAIYCTAHGVFIHSLIEEKIIKQQQYDVAMYLWQCCT